MESLIKRFKIAILNFRHGRVLFITSSVFALVYHLAFLITFKLLGVTQMYYFNFISVAVYIFISLRSFKMKNVIPYYFLCFAEVVVHQILADYYLGGDAEFHYFILLVGLLPALSFGKRIKLASVLVTASVILFLVIEANAAFIFPIYFIEFKKIVVIRIVNIGCVAFVISASLLMYAYIVLHVEDNLEEQVKQKTKKIVKLQDHTIDSLANLVENRDIDTGDHIKRTSAYVNLLALKAYENMVYPKVIDWKFVELITRVAPLHDIGKIVVPDSILKKPGKLTDEEYNTMKMHTTEGVRIIKEIFNMTEDNEYVKMAMDVAGYHHEFWDGRGYPNGLKGDQIPVSARIMAIADVFDALVSVRCYKKAIPVEDAFKILKEEERIHFDPILTEIFLQNKDAVIKILNKEMSL